jgi:hypothetical protein
VIASLQRDRSRFELSERFFVRRRQGEVVSLFDWNPHESIIANGCRLQSAAIAHSVCPALRRLNPE